MISIGEKQKLRLKEAVNRADAAYTAATIAPLQAPSSSAVEGAYFPNQRHLLLTSSVETLSALVKDIEGLDSRLRRIEWSVTNNNNNPRLINVTDSGRCLYPTKGTETNKNISYDYMHHTEHSIGTPNIGPYYSRDEVSLVSAIVSVMLRPIKETLQRQESLIMDVVSTLNCAIEEGTIKKVNSSKSVKQDKKEALQKKSSHVIKEPDFFEEQLARRILRLKELARETRKELQTVTEDTATVTATPSSGDPLTTPTTIGSTTRDTKTTTITTSSRDPLVSESDEMGYPMYGRVFRRLIDVSSSEGCSGAYGGNQSSFLLDQVHDILKRPIGFLEPNYQIERSVVHFSTESTREPSIITPDSGLGTANTSIYGHASDGQIKNKTFVTLMGSAINTNNNSFDATRYPNTTLISENSRM